MILPKDHICYEIEGKVQKLIAPLTKLGDISYFCYGVNYPNTSGFTLTSCVQYYENWLQKEFPLRGFFYRTGWHLNDKLRPNEEIEVGKKFDLGDLITFVEHHHDKTIILEFGSYIENKSVINFYLNNQNLMKKFGNYFLESIHSWLPTIHKQLITPSSTMVIKDKTIEPHSKNHNTTCVKNLMQDLSYPFNLLSKRESECFSFLLQGYSIEKMSEILKVAVPTIANYIARIKAKLNCSNRMEMIQKAKKAYLIEYYLNVE